MNTIVQLINYTQGAKELLIITKNTRLKMTADFREQVFNMSEEEKDKEIAYIATSIPSSWEFVDYTFSLCNVSRAFAEQFKRTRTGSYAQQTMRMLPMEKFTYEIGPSIMADPLKWDRYTDAMNKIQDAYDWLLQAGAAVEDARGILPLNIHTNLVAKFNLRTLADMARSRTGKRTQLEYRDVLDMMLVEVVKVHPWAKDFLFKDIPKIIKQLENYIAKMDSPADLKVGAYKLLDQIRRLV